MDAPVNMLTLLNPRKHIVSSLDAGVQALNADLSFASAIRDVQPLICYILGKFPRSQH